MRVRRYFIELFILLLSSLIIGNVYASDYSKAQADASAKKAYLLCNYESNNSKNEGVKIYFYPINKAFDSKRTWNEWEVFYKTKGDDYKTVGSLGNKSKGIFKNVFLNNRIYYNYQDKKSYFEESFEDKFVCPQYAFIDLDGNKELCFSDTTTGCSDKKFDRGSMNLISNKDSLFVQIDDYIEKQYKNIKSYATDDTKDGLNGYGAVLNSDATVERIKLNTLEYLVTNYFNNYSSSGTSSAICTVSQKVVKSSGTIKSSDYAVCLPKLVYNYVNNGGSKYTEEYEKGINELSKEVETAYKNGEITEEQYQEFSKNVDDIKSDAKVIFNGSGTNNSSSGDAFERVEADDFSHNCKDIARVLKLGGALLILIKVFLPLIIIVRTTFDMFSVVTKGNPDELKKNFSKMMTSIVAAILIFFIPSIVNAVFELSTSNISDSYKSADVNVCRACIFEPFSNDCESNINN